MIGKQRSSAMQSCLINRLQWIMSEFQLVLVYSSDSQLRYLHTRGYFYSCPRGTVNIVCVCVSVCPLTESILTSTSAVAG